MANKTLYELLPKGTINATDIIPIQNNDNSSLLEKVTVDQLKNFIWESNAHIIDLAGTIAEQKIIFNEIYADYLAGEEYVVYVCKTTTTVEAVSTKSYYLAQMEYTDSDEVTFSIAAKYHTIDDDETTVTTTHISMGVGISKFTGIVNTNITTTTENFVSYKNTYIDQKLTETVGTSEIAGKLGTARTIALTGDATGSVSFDGSEDVSIVVTVVDDEHGHTVSTIVGLQDELDRRLLATSAAIKADKLTTPRTISLSGDATGSVSFDGSANIDIAVTVVDDLHAHTIDNVDGLQNALDGKLPAGNNAVSASKLQTTRAIALSGDVSGTTNFDGSSDVSIDVTVDGTKHEHAISTITGLQDILDSKPDQSGAVASADKLTTARTITLDGDVSGSVSFDGSANVTMDVTVESSPIIVSDTVPVNAEDDTIFINTGEHNRYDTSHINQDIILDITANEIIFASGTISITLHPATEEGVIKRIINEGEGAVQIIGTINGEENAYIFPDDVVELVTDGTGWRG